MSNNTFIRYVVSWKACIYCMEASSTLFPDILRGYFQSKVKRTGLGTVWINGLQETIRFFFILPECLMRDNYFRRYSEIVQAIPGKIKLFKLI